MQLLMISPAPISNTPKVNKNIIIVYIGIAVSILSVIAVVVIAATQLGPRTYGNSNATTTPTAIVTSTPTPTLIAVNNKANIYLKQGVATNNPGGIESINPLTLEKKMLVNTSNVVSLFSWSQDNRYLAMTINENTSQIIAFWDNENNNILKTNLKYVAQSSSIWNTNEEFTYLDYSNSALEITTITLPTLSLKTSKIEIKQDIAQAHISKQLDKVIYAIAKDNSIVYLNLETGKKASLNNIDINLSDYQGAFWIDSTSFIFYSKDGIFIYDTNLTQAQTLVTLRSAEVDPLNSNGLTLSADRNNIYFVYESKLFKYSLNSKITKEIYNLTAELPLTSSIELSVLPNERNIALTYKEKTKLLNVAKGTLTDLCDKFCNEVVVEN